MYPYLYNADDMLKDIRTGDLEKDVLVARNTLAKVLVTSATGQDMSYLFADLVKLLASTDFVIKKLVGWFMASNVPRDSELIILAVNTLIKDSQDSNPLIRGSSLRTLGVVNLPSLDEHKIHALTSGLGDSDPYVRRAAVLSCLTLSEHSQFINHLYSLIRDKDPIVVVNCLIALQNMLHSEGGVVINRNIARHLLHQINEFPEPQVLIVIRFLMKYKPRNEDDAIDAMNAIDPVLKSNNAAIVILGVEYLLFLVTESGMQHLRQQVVIRARHYLLYILSGEASEMSFAVIQFIMDHLLPEFSPVFQSYHNPCLWYCRHSDPSYLKVSKIRLLPEVTSESTMVNTVRELALYSHDACCQVAVNSVKAIGKLMSKFSVHAAECCRILMSIIDSTSDENVWATTLTVLHTNWRICVHHKQVIESVLRCPALADLSSASEKSICALLPVLTSCADVTGGVSYIIEEIVDRVTAPSNELICMLLSSVLRLFVKQPAENQELLGRILELGASSSDVDVRDRVTFYYTLLQSNVAQIGLLDRLVEPDNVDLVL